MRSRILLVEDARRAVTYSCSALEPCLVLSAAPLGHPEKPNPTKSAREPRQSLAFRAPAAAHWEGNSHPPLVRRSTRRSNHRCRNILHCHSLRSRILHLEAVAVPGAVEAPAAWGTFPEESDDCLKLQDGELVLFHGRKVLSLIAGAEDPC